jgi:hypothetical protein
MKKKVLLNFGKIIGKTLLKDELKIIISGTGFVTKGTAIQAVANHIRKSKATGSAIEKKEPVKEQEAVAILKYARLHNFFFTSK